jgi:hypothetical protein
MPTQNKVVVFVHGWSVTSTDTYGGLPVRLRNEARARGLAVQVEEIFLGRLPGTGTAAEQYDSR